MERPPGPRSRSPLGLLPEFRKGPNLFFERVAREYGDVAYFRLGVQRTYLVSDPELIRGVLVTDQRQFVKSHALHRLKVLLGEGLLTSDGEFHLRQRRLSQPGFHRERLAGYAAAMVRRAVAARERWRDGETVDLHREMMRLTLGIVGETLFSADVEGEADEIGAALNDILAQFHTLLIPGSQYLGWLPFGSAKVFQCAMQRLNRTVYRIIGEHRASGADQGDLLSMLLEAVDEETGERMSDRQVRDEAMTLMLAGHETTANALTWAFYLLSQNPECERRLHEEVDALGGRAPGFEDLPRLGYAEMVLAEAMRLYPPAWSVGRMSPGEYRLGKWTVPAGSVIAMSQWVVHRDARWWPEPERFVPERFAAEEREKRPKFAYFPFGGGTRQCIGERFAWMEGTLVLAAIAQKWRARLVEGQKVETEARVTLRPRWGMGVRVEEREEAGSEK